MPYSWISFTTDYGLEDGYVAACHGVIARIAPQVKIIDVAHGIAPQQIRYGATVLTNVLPYLPEAVHLAVVDPGVGSERRGVVIVAENGLLVGPDNGLLISAAEQLGGIQAAYELVESAYQLPKISKTFHGRDIFGPAAAHLALRVAPEEFGPPVTDLVRLSAPKVELKNGELTTDVIMIDRFGNIQLAATEADLKQLGDYDEFLVHCGDSTLKVLLGKTFSDAPWGSGVLYPVSQGVIAFAVNGGSAAAALNAGSAQDCTITLSPIAT